MALVAPSMLAADFMHLSRCVDTVNASGDIFHLDVMDGTFVPNISFGFPVIDAIASEATRPLDAHLMVIEPWKWIERVAKTGSRMMSVHMEALCDMRKYADYHGVNITENRVDQTLLSIRAAGMKAGLVINPDIPVEELFPYLQTADFVLIMSVFAGFGGQKFIENTYAKVSAVKAECERIGRRARFNGTDWTGCAIEVDGGVSPDNSGALVAAGADILVAGSAVFKSKDPVATVASMKG